MRHIFLILAALCIFATPALAGSIPQTADTLATTLDAQLAERLGLEHGPARGTALIVTTPANLDDLEQSSPLARQLAEELATWFVGSGYKVQEIRKGKYILLKPGRGEMLLTRDVQLADNRYVHSAVMLTGTYSRTSKHVRFNVRLIHTPSNEVLAMSSATLPLTHEVAELLNMDAREEMSRIRPSVETHILRSGDVQTTRRPTPLIVPDSMAQGPDTIDLTTY
ncbi:FlgO family outer membrane protein [Desulfobaculum senezii]|uniref:FlgO family outer membrane protein n=1 Tax=Desulfobaculum sp. SPO524 TaxID=3378071 RepID=UPI0038525F8B